jgi:Flp pilus assembly protein TadG
MNNDRSHNRQYRGSASHLQHERGVATVEFALILPLLILLMVCTIDFARIMYTAMALTTAARAGAQYGAQGLGSSSNISGMQTAAQNSASPDIGTITATATQTCGCNGATPTAAACTASCSGALRVFVSVTTGKTFTTIMSYPGIPSSVSLTRTAELRAQ